MKCLILVLVLSALSTYAFANVDVFDDTSRPGMKLVVFSGTDGTAAAALFNHLTAATQSVDKSTPNVVNTYRTGSALNCKKTEQDGQANDYECRTDVTSNGTFQTKN